MNNFMEVNEQVNSDDLEDALKHGRIDSAEFDKICNSLLNCGLTEDLYAKDVTMTNEDFTSLAMDAPQMSYGGRVSIDAKPVIVEAQIGQWVANTASPVEKLHPNDQKIVDRIITELVAFMKTKPPTRGVVAMLGHLFTNQFYISKTGDTVLHLLVSESNYKNNFFLFLLKLLLKYQQMDLINLCNKNGQTALYLAVESHDLTVVHYLTSASADVSIEDFEGNTALHIAVMNSAPIAIVDLLLSRSDDTKKYIDQWNYVGYTALHMAVKTSNLPAIKLLCRYHADVNAHTAKDGDTALHMAVADGHIDIVTFLLENKDIEPKREDCQQWNALKLAKVLIRKEKPVTTDIYNILENYMKTNGIFEEVDITEEINKRCDAAPLVVPRSDAFWMPDIFIPEEMSEEIEVSPISICSCEEA